MTKEVTIIQFYKQLIKENALKKGAILPVENELCSMFNASRMTVRKAIDKLVEQGWIIRIGGKGTFVSQIAVENAYALQGLSEFLGQKGVSVKSKILEFAEIDPERHIAEILQIPKGTHAYHLKRLRIADEKPICLESVYLNTRLFPNLMSYDFSSASLYSTLRNAYNCEIVRSSQTIYTIDVDGQTAENLFNKKTATAMKAVNLGYDKNSRLIEYEEAYYNGYEYSFNIIVRKE